MSEVTRISINRSINIKKNRIDAIRKIENFSIEKKVKDQLIKEIRNYPPDLVGHYIKNINKNIDRIKNEKKE